LGASASLPFPCRFPYVAAAAAAAAAAQSQIWNGQRPFSIRNEAAMVVHLWATCEAALAKFPNTTFKTVGDDIELLQGGTLADDPLLYQLVRYRLGEKFVIASCIDAMRPSAFALLEQGLPTGTSL